jgi:hypothetical protein
LQNDVVTEGKNPENFSGSLTTYDKTRNQLLEDGKRSIRTTVDLLVKEKQAVSSTITGQDPTPSPIPVETPSFFNYQFS